MQRLRQASFLARLVLAWFALSVGVAIASPLVQPQAFDLVCTGGSGMRLQALGGDEPAPDPMPDCPLCASTAPPNFVAQAFGAAQPLSHALLPIEAARIASLTAAPLPARGPPLR